MMTPFGGTLKELGKQRRICRVHLVCEMEKQFSTASVLFFAIQKLFETEGSSTEGQYFAVPQWKNKGALNLLALQVFFYRMSSIYYRLCFQ